MWKNFKFVVGYLLVVVGCWLVGRDSFVGEQRTKNQRIPTQQQRTKNKEPTTNIIPIKPSL
jgi:hypothetical protein